MTFILFKTFWWRIKKILFFLLFYRENTPHKEEKVIEKITIFSSEKLWILLCKILLSLQDIESNWEIVPFFSPFFSYIIFSLKLVTFEKWTEQNIITFFSSSPFICIEKKLLFLFTSFVSFFLYIYRGANLMRTKKTGLDMILSTNQRPELHSICLISLAM